jgi:hypothetical protein
LNKVCQCLRSAAMSRSRNRPISTECRVPVRLGRTNPDAGHDAALALRSEPPRPRCFAPSGCVREVAVHDRVRGGMNATVYAWRGAAGPRYRAVLGMRCCNALPPCRSSPLQGGGGGRGRRSIVAGETDMTSEARIAANRLNAMKSTGPRTRAGKAVVGLNNMKHGILSREVLVQGGGISHRACWRA